MISLISYIYIYIYIYIYTRPINCRRKSTISNFYESMSFLRPRDFSAVLFQERYIFSILILTLQNNLCLQSFIIRAACFVVIQIAHFTLERSSYLDRVIRSYISANCVKLSSHISLLWSPDAQQYIIIADCFDFLNYFRLPHL